KGKSVHFGSQTTIPQPRTQSHPIGGAGAGDTDWQEGERARAVFENPQPRRVTTALVALNVAVFVIGLGLALSRGIPAGTYLHPWGEAANADRYRELLKDMGSLNADGFVRDGQWWRVVSYQFLHSGVFHLF